MVKDQAEFSIKISKSSVRLCALNGYYSIFDFEVHPFLNFTAHTQTKASFKDKSGKMWWVDNVQGLDMQEVAKRGLSYDPYHFVESSVLQSTETEYFFSIMKNRLDS